MDKTRKSAPQSRPSQLPASIFADPPQTNDELARKQTFQQAHADVDAGPPPAETGNHIRPVGVERAMRSRVVQSLAAAVSIVAMFGCSTSTTFQGVGRTTSTAVKSPAHTTTSLAENPGRPVRVVEVAEWTNTDVLSLKVGESVVLLTPPVAARRPDGSAIQWGAPHPQTETSLLRFGSTSDCADGAACTTVVALSAGTTTIEVSGPSGVLCPKPAAGGGCIGVASIRKELSVTVTAAS